MTRRGRWEDRAARHQDGMIAGLTDGQTESGLQHGFLLLRAVRKLRKIVPGDPGFAEGEAAAHYTLAALLDKAGRRKEAVEAAHLAVEIYAEACQPASGHAGPGPARRWDLVACLADAQARLARLLGAEYGAPAEETVYQLTADALTAYERLAVVDRRHASETRRIVEQCLRARDHVARALLLSGEYERAAILYEAMLSLGRDRLGPEDELTRTLQQILAVARNPPGAPSP